MVVFEVTDDFSDFGSRPANVGIRPKVERGSSTEGGRRFGGGLSENAGSARLLDDPDGKGLALSGGGKPKVLNTSERSSGVERVPERLNPAGVGDCGGSGYGNVDVNKGVEGSGRK